MKFFIPICIILFLIILYLSGPRENIDTTIHPISLPDDIDEYLAAQEGKVTDITTGTEKTIVWAGVKGKKTDYSVIYIHGYSATRQETSPVTENFTRSLGANIFFTRLKGHGRTSDDMKEARLNHWVNDVWEAYEIGKRIGNKVIVIGNSTGAPLATWLVSKVKDSAALILMSPNFKPADITAGLLLGPWGSLFARIFVGKYFEFEPKNPGHEKYWTVKCASRSLCTMAAACKIGRTSDIEGIIIPVLILYTENDQIISIPTIKQVYNRFGSKKKRIINIKEALDHDMTGDINAPHTTKIVTGHIIRFLAEAL
jgi:esterase/lipase